MHPRLHILWDGKGVLNSGVPNRGALLYDAVVELNKEREREERKREEREREEGERMREGERERERAPGITEPQSPVVPQSPGEDLLSPRESEAMAAVRMERQLLNLHSRRKPHKLLPSTQGKITKTYKHIYIYIRMVFCEDLQCVSKNGCPCCLGSVYGPSHPRIGQRAPCPTLRWSWPAARPPGGGGGGGRERWPMPTFLPSGRPGLDCDRLHCSSGQPAVNREHTSHGKVNTSFVSFHFPFSICSRKYLCLFY